MIVTKKLYLSCQFIDKLAIYLVNISYLFNDNWWWRPDFLHFLKDLIGSVEGRKITSEEMESLLGPVLTEEMAERES